MYPRLWRSATGSSGGPSAPLNPPSWCKCGKCHEEEDPQDRLCCENHVRNHENAVFEQVVLDEHKIEVALMNNADWLSLPRIFTAAKMCNMAYRQYILRFWGKLGYKNCIHHASSGKSEADILNLMETIKVIERLINSTI